jgi:hypothetical protein
MTHSVLATRYHWAKIDSNNLHILLAPAFSYTQPYIFEVKKCLDTDYPTFHLPVCYMYCRDKISLGIRGESI